MSRDFGKISTSIWGSQKFLALSGDEARLLYLYLHTCPHGNAIGCFRLPKGYATTDLHWSEKTFDSAIEALCEVNLTGFDRAENVVRIVDFLRHAGITNPKHGAGAVKAALSLPDCEQKHIVCNELSGLQHIDSGALKKALSEPSDRAIPTETTTTTTTETEQTYAVASAPAVTHVKHSPPAEIDLTLPKELDRRKASRLASDFVVPEGWKLSGAEARERHGLPAVNLDLEAEKFVDYWTSKAGQTATKMDWRKTFVNWCRNANGPGPPKPQAGFATVTAGLMAKYGNE
jgi:hypothetical protein